MTTNSTTTGKYFPPEAAPTSIDDPDVRGFIIENPPRWVGNELTVQPFSLKGQLRGKLFPAYFTAAGVTRAHKSVPAELFLNPANVTGKERGIIWPTLYTVSGKTRLSPERIREIKAEACKIMRERKAAMKQVPRRKRTNVGKKARKLTYRNVWKRPAARRVPELKTVEFATTGAARPEPTHDETVRNVQAIIDHQALMDAAAMRMRHDMEAVTDYMKGLADRLFNGEEFTDDTYYAINYWIEFGNRCAKNFPDNVRDLMKEREDEEASEATED